ncbi:hypothetical protein ACFX13_028541 [Malus domestica]
MERSSLSLDFAASSIKLLKPLRRQRQALLSSQLSMAKVCRMQISPLPVQLGSQLPATAIAAFGSASARAVTVVPSVFGTGIDGSGDDRKVGARANSFVSKSLRMSKRRGVALLKNNIRGMGTAVSVLTGEKERENTMSPLTPPSKQKPAKNSSSSSSASSEWVKVSQTGKHYKELSALH